MTFDAAAIQPGWDLYGSDGEKIGTIEEIGPNYVLVRKGLIFTHDIYVPSTAATEIDEQSRAVYANVTKGQVDGAGWDQPPLAPAATDYTGATGYAGTTGYATGATGGADTAAYGTAGSAGRTGSTGYAAAGGTDTTRLERYEEDLSVQTRAQQAGEVQVGKNVIEEQRSVDVPVTHEEVEITRRPVDRPATAATTAFSDGDTIRVPVVEEVVEVTKQPRVVEELEIRKVAKQETQRVSDTVRREQFQVQPTGDATIRQSSGTGSTAGTYDESALAGAGASRMQGAGDWAGDRGTGGNSDKGEGGGEVAGGGIGAVAGATGGALVGGPIGAAIGGVVGAVAGAGAGETADHASGAEEDENDGRI